HVAGGRLGQRPDPQRPQRALAAQVTGVGVDLVRRLTRAARVVRSAMSTAPRCASACGPTSRFAAARASVRATPRAPPYQHAATPAPPWLNHGRPV
ncbi:MAG: hypothetical protein ACRDOI_23450, partial [Trebonia sp.]